MLDRNLEKEKRRQRRINEGQHAKNKKMRNEKNRRDRNEDFWN